MTEIHPNDNLLDSKLSDYVSNTNIPKIHKDFCKPNTYITINTTKPSYAHGETVRVDLPNNNLDMSKHIFDIGVVFTGTDDSGGAANYVHEYIRTVEDLIGEFAFFTDETEILRTPDVGLIFGALEKLEDVSDICQNRRNNGYELGSLCIAGPAVSIGGGANGNGQYGNKNLPWAPNVAYKSCYGLLSCKDPDDTADGVDDQGSILWHRTRNVPVHYIFKADKLCSMLGVEFLPLKYSRAKFHMEFTLKPAYQVVQNCKAGYVANGAVDPLVAYTITMQFKYLSVNTTDKLDAVLSEQFREGDRDPTKAWIISSKQRQVISFSLTDQTSFSDLTVSQIDKLRSLIMILQRTSTSSNFPYLHNVLYDGLDDAGVGVNGNNAAVNNANNGIKWRLSSSDETLYPQMEVTLTKTNFAECLNLLRDVYGETRNDSLNTSLVLCNDLYQENRVNPTNPLFSVPDYVNKSSMFGFNFMNHREDNTDEFSCGFNMTNKRLNLRIDSLGNTTLSDKKLYVIYEYERLILLSENYVRIQ